ncbi:MAG TPA: hypothetical protein VGH87_22645, partial [Polyangiaceae bacterium]
LERVQGRHDFFPQVTIDATEMNNGRAATMTISVPASTAPGKVAVFYLRSFHAGDASYALQPVVVMSQ